MSYQFLSISVGKDGMDPKGRRLEKMNQEQFDLTDMKKQPHGGPLGGLQLPRQAALNTLSRAAEPGSKVQEISF